MDWWRGVRYEFVSVGCLGRVVDMHADMGFSTYMVGAGVVRPVQLHEIRCVLLVGGDMLHLLYNQVGGMINGIGKFRDLCK